MKIFLSWSGERSREIATLLKHWLRRVIQRLDPWISTDLDKGSRWSPEISKSLEDIKVGIICLTPENLEEPWIHFEAGALSKTADAYVCTILFEITDAASVKPPLGQFQHTLATQEDLYRLIRTINGLLPDKDQLPEIDLKDSFDTHWPKFRADLGKISKPTKVAPAKRELEDMMSEALEMLRDLKMREVAQNALVDSEGRISYTPPMGPGKGLSREEFVLEVEKMLRKYMTLGKIERQMGIVTLTVDPGILGVPDIARLKRLAEANAIDFRISTEPKGWSEGH